ncbi:MAG: hypothetical protein R3F19_29375 [Verrucomicrobiales bacterium]
MSSDEIESISRNAPTPGSGSRTDLFPITQWSAISRARSGDDSGATSGLRMLAVNYWRPLYLYLRKRGENHEDASDSVQGFFEFVFSSGFLSHVDREGGKFRSYLLRSLERWRTRQQVREGAQKRGGHIVHVPLDGIEEFRFASETSAEASPEAAFDQQWAIDMVKRAVISLRDDYSKRGRENWFDTLRAALPGGGQLPAYTELASQLDTSQGAIKKAVFDLRHAFGECLRDEIRATVRTNEDAEEELRYLVSVMGNR